MYNNKPLLSGEDNSGLFLVRLAAQSQETQSQETLCLLTRNVPEMH